MEKTFELKTLKLTAFGADCKYKIVKTDDDGVVTENDYHVKVSSPLHPDLTNLFSQDLTKILAEIIGTPSDIADVEFQQTTLSPDGITFAGKNDNIGISIQGVRSTKFGKIKFKTPRIRYKTSETDVAALLTVFAEKVVNETYAYLFQGKVAQMEVFGGGKPGCRADVFDGCEAENE